MDKVKVKPTEGQDFKQLEVSTKNWNLDTRKKVNKLIATALSGDESMFDSYCEIIDIATTLTEDEVFNLSAEEIQTIGQQIAIEINKKK